MRTQLSMMSLIIAAAVTAAGCQGRLAYNLPPSERLMHPGPGVGGPGPGVLPTGGMSGGAAMMGGPGMGPGMGMMGGGACQAMPPGAMPPGAGPASNAPGNNIQQVSFQSGCMGGGCYDGGCMDGGCMGGACGASGASQIAFLGEDGTQVQWDVSGQGMFDSNPIVVPGRQNFYQGAIYRLRVSNISGRPGVQLYPTLEVAPVTPRTDAYLAHAPIPVQFSEEDFDQVLSGNFVTKVMYLPDPEFQELALAGVETLVSARLDPGVDPIAEADRRGSILAILRIGSKDLEMTGGYSDGQVLPAQFEDSFDEPMLEPIPSGDYSSGEDSYPVEGEVIDGGSFGESYQGESYGGEGCYGGQGCSDGYVGNMPMGMQTAGFAPAAVPPHMMPSMGPQYGMPITGTPIGLPGPPHIPMGAPAGLQKHVMKNRTRMAIPSPVEKFKISVKQRPGLNYPEPVRKVKVDETVRQPFSFRALLGK